MGGFYSLLLRLFFSFGVVLLYSDCDINQWLENWRLENIHLLEVLEEFGRREKGAGYFSQMTLLKVVFIYM